jgi:hypothetical protein
MFFLFPSPIRATHEADHRFIVSGYVRDARGNAVQDARVIVVDTRIGEGSTAFTDPSGYYEVLLHLHNENLGDEIRITAQDETKMITATFDSKDATTERRVQVDFGEMLGEGRAGFQYLWIYGAGAALVVAAILYWGVYSRKRNRASSQSQGLKKGSKK